MVAMFALDRFDPPLAMAEIASGPVLLRPFALSDLAVIRQATEDPYIPAITAVPEAYSDDAGRSFLERQANLAAEGHGLSFAIAAASDPGRAVGSLGLWLREIAEGRASIGYWIVPSERRRQFATWALRGALTYAFAELAIPRLQLFIEPWNVASQRAATTAGFTREALLRGWARIGDTQHDVYVYALLREMWRPPEPA
jgi:RimJ/RimL family protein N-acetyltransferase